MTNATRHDIWLYISIIIRKSCITDGYSPNEWSYQWFFKRRWRWQDLTTHLMVINPVWYPLRHWTKENLGQIFLRVNYFEKKIQDGWFFSDFSKKIFLHFLQLWKTQKFPKITSLARACQESNWNICIYGSKTCLDLLTYFYPSKGRSFYLMDLLKSIIPP